METRKLTFFIKSLKFVNAQSWIVGHLGKRVRGLAFDLVTR